METPVALLILLASVATGITGAAVLSRRHRAKWRTVTHKDDSAYRGSVDERVGLPLRVRVAVALSFLMAAMCAFRVAATVDDIMNLADGPHIRLRLVPGGMYATIIAAVLMVTAAGAIPRLLQSGRNLARRVESVAPSRAAVLLALSIGAAGLQLYSMRNIPIVVYWQRRMILYLAVHILLSAVTAIALFRADGPRVASSPS